MSRQASSLFGQIQLPSKVGLDCEFFIYNLLVLFSVLILLFPLNRQPRRADAFSSYLELFLHVGSLLLALLHEALQSGQWPNGNPIPYHQPLNSPEMQVKRREEEVTDILVGNTKEQVKPLGFGMNWDAKQSHS